MVAVHDDVIPFELIQFRDKPRLEFESFDRAIDTYFSELEAQKLEMRALQQVTMAAL